MERKRITMRGGYAVGRGLFYQQSAEAHVGPGGNVATAKALEVGKMRSKGQRGWLHGSMP
jgi:hypothetical protein